MILYSRTCDKLMKKNIFHCSRSLFITYLHRKIYLKIMAYFPIIQTLEKFLFFMILHTFSKFSLARSLLNVFFHPIICIQLASLHIITQIQFILDNLCACIFTTRGRRILRPPKSSHLYPRHSVRNRPPIHQSRWIQCSYNLNIPTLLHPPAYLISLLYL